MVRKQGNQDLLVNRKANDKSSTADMFIAMIAQRSFLCLFFFLFLFFSIIPSRNSPLDICNLESISPAALVSKNTNEKTNKQKTCHHAPAVRQHHCCHLAGFAIYRLCHHHKTKYSCTQEQVNRNVSLSDQYMWTDTQGKHRKQFTALTQACGKILKDSTSSASAGHRLQCLHLKCLFFFLKGINSRCLRSYDI